jgi:hypothetical protein
MFPIKNALLLSVTMSFIMLKTQSLSVELTAKTSITFVAFFNSLRNLNVQ